MYADDTGIPLPAIYVEAADPTTIYTDGRSFVKRLWRDTSTGLIGTLKIRNAANDGWDALINFDAVLANDFVTNALLANMAQATIKGRAAGAGTGDPTDLTATQATAILNAVVGDSGAGGTKGLVPAPGAGDAVAGKYLDAAGLFSVPPGTGLTTEQVQDVVGAMLTDNNDLDWTYDDGAGTEVATIKPGASPLSPATATLTDGATITWATAGARQNNARITLGDNRTLDITGEVDGATGLLIVKQDATGGRTLTLPGSSLVISDGGGVVALSTGANEIDILTWYFDGTNFFWTMGVNYS